MQYHCCLLTYKFIATGMKSKIQLRFTGLLAAFHSPECQLHNLGMLSLGDYVLLSLNKATYNPSYKNSLFINHCSIPGFNPPLFIYLFIHTFFFFFPSLVCVSSSDVKQVVWVRGDVSLVGNELMKNPCFL